MNWFFSCAGILFALWIDFAVAGQNNLLTPDQVAVYRYLQARTGEHFFTASSEEAHVAGYRFEGVGFMLLSFPQGDAVPLFRCMITGKMHFVSTDSKCEGAANEGTYGYLYSSSASDRAPLYQFYSPRNGDHLATQDIREGLIADYQLDGILGYVPIRENGISQPFKITDAEQASSDSPWSYAYGPSIIASEGVYHAYFCSTGTGVEDWDHIRHVSSPDLIHWNVNAQNLMQSTAVERANCDPSVVRFNAGDGLYYYDFHSGNTENVQTVVFASRSSSVNGSFSKYTERGTWEIQPEDPHPIVVPFHPSPDNSGVYGAGQASVVVMNQTLYMWHTDTTENYPAQTSNAIYLRTSSDGIHWSEPTRTNVSNASIDVKYNPTTQEFVMAEILEGHTYGSRLSIRTSADGLLWSESKIIADTDVFPHFANNVGMSGDEQGHLIEGETVLISYGAPYDLSTSYGNDCALFPAPHCWGHWNLYGNRIAPEVLGVASSGSALPKKKGAQLERFEMFPNPARAGQRAILRLMSQENCNDAHLSLIQMNGAHTRTNLDSFFTGGVTGLQLVEQEVRVPDVASGVYVLEAMLTGCGTLGQGVQRSTLTWVILDH